MSHRNETGMSALLPAVASGVIVGVVLGLIGGGGSILAVPLLVYFVGVRSPHMAIGTSARGVGQRRGGQPGPACSDLITSQSRIRLTPRLVRTGLTAGATSAYFGIGGGV